MARNRSRATRHATRLAGVEKESVACRLEPIYPVSMRHRDRAICIRTTDYSETSQVLHFLTRNLGVVSLLAKGSKRPKSSTGGAIDILAQGDLVFSTKASGALGILVEFSETLWLAGLRTDAGRLNAALYMVELIGEFLAPEDPHPAVFDLLHNALVRLAQPGAPTQAVLAYFQWRLLRNLGLLGGLGHCQGCSLPVSKMPVKSDVYFSGELGGILCHACRGISKEKFPLEPSARSALAALAAAEAGQRVHLPEHQASRANRLMAYHITQQLGKGLRMTRHVIGTGPPPGPSRPGASTTSH